MGKGTVTLEELISGIHGLGEKHDSWVWADRAFRSKDESICQVTANICALLSLHVPNYPIFMAEE